MPRRALTATFVVVLGVAAAYSCHQAGHPLVSEVLARDLGNLFLIRDDGRYANSPLKPWFDNLGSKKGLCCSFADGFSISDVDWDTLNGHYQGANPPRVGRGAG
jgi:hypothetical protein